MLAFVLVITGPSVCPLTTIALEEMSDCVWTSLYHTYLLLKPSRVMITFTMCNPMPLAETIFWKKRTRQKIVEANATMMETDLGEKVNLRCGSPVSSGYIYTPGIQRLCHP